jgi:heme/copper-type cytochrome/quinol oxidase subunit 3
MANHAESASINSGVSHAKLGMWLFLASEIMLFSTLFTSYIIFRVTAPAWPHGWEVLDVRLGALNTAVLITSSVTMVFAYMKALERDRAGFKMYLGLTIALSFVFLIVKYFEYMHKFEAGHFPSTNMFYGVYFTMTGLHGIHVICGIIANSILLWMSGRDFEESFFAGRIEAAGLYWHFVDIVWIFLFPTIYLL